MSDRRELPHIEWGPVLFGLAVTLALTLAATAFGFGGEGLPLAVGAGGYVAARRIPAARLLHAALVGAAAVLIFGAAPVAGPEGSGVVADTAATLAVDILYMCAALAGGWLAGRR